MRKINFKALFKTIWDFISAILTGLVIWVVAVGFILVLDMALAGELWPIICYGVVIFLIKSKHIYDDAS